MSITVFVDFVPVLGRRRGLRVLGGPCRRLSIHPGSASLGGGAKREQEARVVLKTLFWENVPKKSCLVLVLLQLSYLSDPATTL